MRAHLKRIFGLRHLRPGQDEVIRHVMEGHDTLALMATGAGKSLCYQLPATLLPGRTLVISPLIALMKDQCDKLRAMGVEAVRIDSAQPASELDAARQAVCDGSARIIITTPEQLSNPSFVGDVSRHPVSLLVVDEAHCVTEWGHGFRPAFLEIGSALKRLGRPVVLALTATATDTAVDEVKSQLDLPGMRVVNTGMYRPNLHYAVDLINSEDAKNARLLTLLQRYEGQGIVYTSTVKAAEQVHELITAQAGETATLYHGRLAAGRRRHAQDAYMQGEARIMVATQAFGLGIDKADTRFVLHYQVPSSLENYYQEAGRAGRDGEVAHCTLLYLSKDKAIQQFFLTGRYPALEDLSALQRQLLQPPPQAPGWTQPDLIAATGRPKTKVAMALHLMRQQKLVREDAGGRLRLRDSVARAPLDDAALQAMLEGYAQRKLHDRDMLESMVFYCQSGLCRWKMILAHFDQDEGFARCGHCDNCVRMRQAQEAAKREAAASGASCSQAQASDHAQAPGVSMPPGPTLNEGDAVRVPRYGRGRVSALDSEGVTVRFPDGRERCFLAEYVKRVRS